MISYGVPQGSVLGPLLSVIDINDIHNSLAKFSFYVFADDTNLLYTNTNLKSLEKTVNSELLQVFDWLNANKLTLNAKKSNYVIFRLYQRKFNYSVNIVLIDSGAPRAREARAWAEPHSLVNLPIPENLVIT